MEILSPGESSLRQSTWISAEVQAVWVTYSEPQKDCGSEYVTLSARKKIHIVSRLFLDWLVVSSCRNTHEIVFVFLEMSFRTRNG